jgi:hypothetical protein
MSKVQHVPNFAFLVPAALWDDVEDWLRNCGIGYEWFDHRDESLSEFVEAIIIIPNNAQAAMFKTRWC